VSSALRALGDAQTARFLQGYFQTQPGGYGAGDVFIGVRVPVVRRLARRFCGLPPAALRRLLRSKIHEERLAALLIMVAQFSRGDAGQRAALLRLYLDHTRHINNWDLVDASAPGIVGAAVADTGRDTLLDELARSGSVWERRIAIIATLHLIRRGDVRPALRIAKALLGDEHDLIHKAAGWMLREAEKRQPAALRTFLDRHCRRMPRTMLRYAIERLEPAERQAYLKGG
jgi:3-methyladenine DNA glycosylase AlkD